VKKKKKKKKKKEKSKKKKKKKSIFFFLSVCVVVVDTSSPIEDSSIDVLEGTTNRVTIAINTRTNNLLDKRTRPHLFRMVPDESTEATVLVDLAQRFGQSRVVVVYENSQFGTVNLATARTRLAAQMITSVRDIEIATNADAAATRTALLPAQAATVAADGKPSNVGTFIYLGNNVTTLERVFTAAASLNITGSPYLWLVASAAQSLTVAAAARPEFRGIVSLSHYANESALAYDAVIAAAAALDASYLSLDNRGLIAQALAAVRFQGQSGPVAFDTQQDRPAQYHIDNVQAGVRVTVGSFVANAFSLNATAVLFATGERGNPVYPFVSCASLRSCADCTLLTKCQWCGQTSTCSLVSAGASVCSGTPLNNPGLCPAECVSSAAPSFCLYPANLTIWSQQKPRCDALNKPLVPPAYLAPQQPNNCSLALARERPCQQLLQRISCSASCQQCGSNSTAQPLPVCQSVCDPLINTACPLTKAACVEDGSPFAFLCGPDTAACTRVVLDTLPLVEPPPTTTSTSTSTSTTTPAPTTPAPATPVSTTTAPVDMTSTPVTTTTTGDGSATTTESTTSESTTSTESTTTESTIPGTPTTTTTSSRTSSTTSTGVVTSSDSASDSTAAPTTTTAPGGSTTTDAAAYASVLADIKKNTTQLYENENNLRIGIGVGLTAFLCCIILLVVCLLSRK
jgi:ABC-type branched-subunit amino acid transport system substrate-binding protein